MDTAMPPSQLLDPYAHGITSGYSDLATTFLGPQPILEKATPWAKKDVAKWNFPDAYWNKSEYLRDTTEDWMFTANQTWYTQRIMPWFKTNDIHIQWENWENNAFYMGITPEQSASNVVTQKRNIRQASMVRRGIGAEFEQGFLTTVTGRASFVASIAQIGRSVQETANVEVIRALLSCHRWQQMYHRKYGIIRDNDIDEYHRRRAERFMCAQKSDTGLETLNVQIDAEMEKYQANANVWIMGREVSDYCTVVPETKIWYMFGGQEAVDRLNGKQQGPSAQAGTMGTVDSLMPLRMIQDTPVFLAKSFYVDSVGSLDLLSRTVEVGVFNIMVDRTYNYNEYLSKSRDIRVYDNDNDDWAEITLEKAIRKCIIWGTNGDVADPFSGIGARLGRAQVTDDNVEGRDDFLRYGTFRSTDQPKAQHAHQDVAYIGDLDERWFTQTQMQAAGKTVYNALKRAYPKQLELAEKAIYESNDSGSVKFTDAPDMNEADRTKYGDKLFSLLEQMLGSDNVFFRNSTLQAPVELEPQTSINSSKQLWRAFAKAGYFAAKVPGIVRLDAPVVSAEATASEEASHRGFFSGYLASAIQSPAYVERFNAIANNSDMSFGDRVVAVKTMMLDLHKSEPNAIPGYQSKQHLERYIDTKVANYERTIEEARALRSGTPSSRVASASAGVEYFQIGTELPNGYTYLNSHEESKARGAAIQCPTSLRAFPFLTHLFEQVGGDSSSGGRGMGGRMAGIGAPQPGTRARTRGEQEVDATGKTGAQRTSDRLLERFNNLDHRIEMIGKGSAPTLIKWLSILFLGSRFNRDRFVSFAANDIYVPAGFLLIRAHATYRTRYGIKCAAGGATGYTFIGNSDMQLEQEAIRKVGVMHYTAYLSAIVINPKNVYVVEDMFCSGYLGGMGVDFWDRDEYARHSNNRKLKSIVCTMLPPNMENKLANKIDIRGKFYTEADMRLVDTDRFNKGCYPGAARTAALMGWWDPIRKGRAAADQASRSRKVAINWICWQGVQFHWNSKIEDWGQPTPEQGSFGNKVYPGCAAVRNGELRYLRTPTYLGSQTIH